MTIVSVLFNLRISGCELRDNYCVSFTQLFKKKDFPLYRHFSDFKSHCGFSIAGAGYTIFPVIYMGTGGSGPHMVFMYKCT